jgi:hypothetical protein
LSLAPGAQRIAEPLPSGYQQDAAKPRRQVQLQTLAGVELIRDGSIKEATAGGVYSSQTVSDLERLSQIDENKGKTNDFL